MVAESLLERRHKSETLHAGRKTHCCRTELIACQMWFSAQLLTSALPKNYRAKASLMPFRLDRASASTAFLLTCVLFQVWTL